MQFFNYCNCSIQSKVYSNLYIQIIWSSFRIFSWAFNIFHSIKVSRIFIIFFNPVAYIRFWSNYCSKKQLTYFLCSKSRVEPAAKTNSIFTATPQFGIMILWWNWHSLCWQHLSIMHPFIYLQLDVGFLSFLILNLGPLQIRSFRLFFTSVCLKNGSQ